MSNEKHTDTQTSEAPGSSTRKRAGLLALVGLAFLFSCYLVWDQGIVQAPNLLPLWGAIAYFAWGTLKGEKRRLSVGLGLFIIAVAWALAWGMVWGPLQSYSWANHLSHLVAATVLGMIAATEFSFIIGLNRERNNQDPDSPSPLASSLVVSMAGLGVVMVCGVGMEIVEAMVHWNWQPGEMMPQDRLHDTVWDLAADLVGGIIGSGLVVLSRKS